MEPNIDLLILTALTEEQQVVHAVLRAFGQRLGVFGELSAGNRVVLYEFENEAKHRYLIATASSHEIGAVAMGTFATSLFKSGIRPASAALVGIAATLKREDVDLADVPVASEVFAGDDIAVENGRLTSRPHGYQVDSLMRRSVGAIKEESETYERWQSQCVYLIPMVVEEVGKLRNSRIILPSTVRKPHLVLEQGVGGPFLIRDPKFRDALRKGSKNVGAISPKLAWAEMESHGFMKAAHDMQVPAIVLKGISDAGDEEKAAIEKQTGGFYRAYACSNSTMALLAILQQTPRRPIVRESRIGSPSSTHDGLGTSSNISARTPSEGVKQKGSSVASDGVSRKPAFLPDLKEFLQTNSAATRAFVDRLETTVAVSGVKATGRFHYLKFNQAGIPQVDQLCRLLARKLCVHCLSARTRQNLKDSISQFDDGEIWLRARERLQLAKNSEEAGEILLFLLIECFYESPQVVCKMDLKQDRRDAVKGASGIHVRWDDDGDALHVFLAKSRLHPGLADAFKATLNYIDEFCREGRESAELHLVTAQFQYLDDAFRRAVTTYLDGGSADRQVCITNVCLIGFDWAEYQRLEKDRSQFVKNFQATYTAFAPEVRAMLDANLANFSHRHLTYDFLFLPFPSVEKFREAFYRELTGGSVG